MPLLAVNIDHIATLRQQRLGLSPDPVDAALIAEASGSAGIIVHLREDRRHIQDHDITRLAANLTTPLHLEMAATAEMQRIALEVRPWIVCLVPEKRQELTTEGGLVVAGREAMLRDYLAPLHAMGIRSSLFIEADPIQLEAAWTIGCEYVELHAGHYADASNAEATRNEFERLQASITLGCRLGLKVNLGHGLDAANILAFALVPGVNEYSIGHSIISRAIFVGLETAVREMADLIARFTV
ncbi:pyridoxine 5'-phosphate synthase [Desulfovibrionales bacterium]